MPGYEPALHSSGGAILLVEDDMPTRTLLSMALSGKYPVLQTRDGVEAVYAFEKNADNIVAVITDLEMPRLGGDILAEWIHSARPEIPIILISGREPGAAALNELLETHKAWFLAKPFDLSDLEALIEEVLAKPARCDCHKPGRDFVAAPLRAAKTG
jgi:two-component system cell cycle sensor histidine kinase/response regulator CckA